jgi:hypothetical protein
VNARPLQRTASQARHYPWTPAILVPGVVLVGPDGTTLIVGDHGELDHWPPRGYRSVASAPTPPGGRR